jgi:uncharacterized protein (DUF488 family)
VPASSDAVYTVGHGNRPIDELIGLLNASRVDILVDVRAHPGSRKHPQFGRSELERSLPAAGIRYVWEGEALGGRRRSHGESPHTALRNESFRAYADHMQTAAFKDGIARVLETAGEARIALMCAERLPWQCHRYMISDWLVAHGVEVRHVIGPQAPRPHGLRVEARLEAGDLIYDRNTQPPLGI